MSNNKIVPIVPFLEHTYYLPDGNLVKLQPHQKALLTFLFTPDKDGNLPFRQVTISCPKKSAKTSTGAMIAAWYAFGGVCPGNSELYFANASMKSSASRGYRMLYKAIEMNPMLMNEIKEGKLNDLRIELKNGTIMEPLALNAGTAAGSNPSLSLFDELWSFTSGAARDLYCFYVDKMPGMMVMTIDGFKPYMSITMNDMIMTRDSNGCIEYQKPTKIVHEDYSGDILNFKHKRSKFSVTPNHRIFGKYCNTGAREGDIPYTYTEASDYSRKVMGWIPSTVDWIGRRLHTVSIPGIIHNMDSGDFLELLGWYLAEGSILSNSTRYNGKYKRYEYGITISQSQSANPDKYYHIFSLCSRLGLNPIGKKDCVVIKNKNIVPWFKKLGLSKFKYVPREFMDASREELSRLFFGYMMGDGHYNRGGFSCSSTSRQLSMDILEVGLKCGLSGRIGKIQDKKNLLRTPMLLRDGINFSKWNPDLHNPYWRVRFTPNRNIFWERRGARNKDNPEQIPTPYWTTTKESGKVWCLSVPNGNFFVASEESCGFWTGNSELTPPPTRTNSVRVITTYAGALGSADLLEEIYKEMVRPENKVDIGSFMNYETGQLTPLPLYVSGASACYWDHEPRMPWQTAAYYKEQLAQPGFRLVDFLRIHRNQWVDSIEGMDITPWNKCVDMGNAMDYTIDSIPRSKDIQIAVGVDASIVKDRTAVVTVFKKNGCLWLGPRRVWQPSHEEPLNFEKTVEAYILELSDQYTVSSVYCDPYQFVSSSQRLQEKGIPITLFHQTETNTITMTENLLDELRNGTMILYEDEELAKEARSVILKENPGKGRRFMKDNKNKKIDSIIALSMAALAAKRHLPDFSDLGSQMMVLNLRKPH